MGNQSDIKFEGLKSALKIVYSSESAVLDFIKKHKKNVGENKENYFTKQNTPFIATYGGYISEETFPCTLESDSMGNVGIMIYKTYIMLNYDTINYRLEKGSLMVNGYKVDISDIESKQDMFSLSTVRDFHDLDFDDIERTNHIYSVLIEAAANARNA